MRPNEIDGWILVDGSIILIKSILGNDISSDVYVESSFEVVFVESCSSKIFQIFQIKHDSNPVFRKTLKFEEFSKKMVCI